MPVFRHSTEGNGVLPRPCIAINGDADASAVNGRLSPADRAAVAIPDDHGGSHAHQLRVELNSRFRWGGIQERIGSWLGLDHVGMSVSRLTERSGEHRGEKKDGPAPKKSIHVSSPFARYSPSCTPGGMKYVADPTAEIHF